MSTIFEWVYGPIATQPTAAARYVKRDGDYVENPVKAHRVIYGQLRYRRTGSILNWAQQVVDGEESESRLAWARSKAPIALDNSESFKSHVDVIDDGHGRYHVPEQPSAEELGELEAGILGQHSAQRIHGYVAEDHASITLFEFQINNGYTELDTEKGVADLTAHFDTRDNWNWTPNDSIGLNQALAIISRRDDKL